MPTDRDASGEQPQDEVSEPPPSPADRPAPSSSPNIRLDRGVAGGVSGDSHVGIDGEPLSRKTSRRCRIG